MDSLTDWLNSGRALNAEQVEEAVARLLEPAVSETEKMDLLKALRTKGETAEEIAAFAQALLKRAVPVALNRERLPGPAIDFCGTGGDRRRRVG